MSFKKYVTYYQHSQQGSNKGKNQYRFVSIERILFKYNQGEKENDKPW